MKRILHGIFLIAAIPAVVAVVSGIALRNSGGWVIRKEQEFRP